MPGIASYAVGLSGLDEDERAHLGTRNLRLNIRGTPNTFPFIGSPLPEPSIQCTNERTPTRNHTRNESVFRIGSTSPPVGVNRGDN